MNLLIVDDSKMILKLAYNILVDSKIEAKILLCESGYEAFKILDENDIDVILLDIVMPDYSGIEILRDLRGRGHLNRTRVLMFSSLSDKYALQECFKLGAFDYISKPLEPIEFLARVNNAISDQRLRIELSKSLEDKINQNKLLENLNLKLKKTQAELIHKEQVAGVGRLAAGVAHEINNPLGFITSNLETLKDYIRTYENIEKILMDIINKSFDVLPKEIRDIIGSEIDKGEMEFIKEDLEFLFEDIEEGLKRVNQIVNGLKKFSTIDKSDQLHFYNMSDSISNIVNTTLGEMKDDIKFELLLEDSTDILAYGSELNQAILNIIRNAVYAVKDKEDLEDGRVRIYVKSDSNYIYCIVEDNGVGIEEEMFNDILKPFFTTRQIGDGIGLGLSIAYDIIVIKHNGALDIESKIGSGTRVTIKLPRFS